MLSGPMTPTVMPTPARLERDPAGLGVRPPPFRRAGLNWVDLALVCIFLLGIYTHYTIQISTRIPFPSAPSGIAGVIMLWRRRDQITPGPLAGFLVVELLYAMSILCATDMSFLSRRFNGLLQLTYSLTIGYALFLTVIEATRRQIANLCLASALALMVGCLLETYGGLRPLSDAVRSKLYSAGIYENDLRDTLLYGRARPKFFASEPATVTFTYSLLSGLWLVVSPWRRKLLVYLGLVGGGFAAMPGPTLLLTLLLAIPYQVFLAPRVGDGLRTLFKPAHILKIICFAAIALVGAAILANTVFSERLRDIRRGNDASFFYRVQGPAIAAEEIVRTYPLAGGGLTGEPFIEDRVVDAYMRSPSFSAGWVVVSPATELLINYFWLHWIYLGLAWGLVITAAITFWLKSLGVPSVLFCWSVWTILGQGSGAYVGPTCWAVMFLAAAVAVLHEGEPAKQRARLPWHPIELYLMAQVRRLAAARRGWV
jgi:hypothetical protein